MFENNFTDLGNLSFSEEIKEYKIPLNKITKNIQQFKDYIIVKENNKFKIYDTVCDHAGGKIILKNNEYICPMHSWKFDPKKGIYNNGIKKKELKFTAKDNFLYFQVKKQVPNIIHDSLEIKFKIRFINHAFIIFSGNNFQFAIDPWAIGPAFNTGWWLRLKSKKDWKEELNKCDFIFVSHNHPDHLNKHTLKHVRKDMNFVVPKYTTDSTGIFIETLGFQNVFRGDFKKQYRFNKTNLIFSILKSGDFRDDSGIYFSVGDFTCLFDVDTNNINFNNLPKADLYGSSFAGGASGYPLVFSNYTEAEKKNIIKNNRYILKTLKQKNLKQIRPKYFIPYAGFFNESLERDKYINLNNKKNNIIDYEKYSKSISCKLLNVENFDEFNFIGKKLISKNKKIKEFYKDISQTKYLQEVKKNYSTIDTNYIKNYFENSNFVDNLLLKIDLTNDNYNIVENTFVIDFSNLKTKFYQNNDYDIDNIIINKKLRFLNIKCRKESFLNTIYNKEPWEDLTIGFQCQIYRKPNIYNAQFWYHFTNIYVTNKNVRGSTNCNSCDRIKQSIDAQMVN